MYILEKTLFGRGIYLGSAGGPQMSAECSRWPIGRRRKWMVQAIDIWWKMLAPETINIQNIQQKLTFLNRIWFNYIYYKNTTPIAVNVRLMLYATFEMQMQEIPVLYLCRLYPYKFALGLPQVGCFVFGLGWVYRTGVCGAGYLWLTKSVTSLTRLNSLYCPRKDNNFVL